MAKPPFGQPGNRITNYISHHELMTVVRGYYQVKTLNYRLGRLKEDWLHWKAIWKNATRYDNTGYYTLKNKSTGQYLSLNNKTLICIFKEMQLQSFRWDVTEPMAVI